MFGFSLSYANGNSRKENGSLNTTKAKQVIKYNFKEKNIDFVKYTYSTNMVSATLGSHNFLIFETRKS